MLSYLGKSLIVLSLCFQGYILLSNQKISQQFTNKLLLTLDKCGCLPDYLAGYILFYARFVIVGLLLSSFFMLFCRASILKLFPLMALLSLLYLQHQGFTKIPCIQCISFWNKVSNIGALIYLMAVDNIKITIEKVNINKDIIKTEKLKEKPQ